MAGKAVTHLVKVTSTLETPARADEMLGIVAAVDVDGAVGELDD